MTMSNPRCLSVLFVAFAALQLGGCCDENVRMAVLVGHKIQRDCLEALRAGKPEPIALVCAGKELTICWGSNVGTITVDPIGSSTGTKISDDLFVGVEYFTPTAPDTTITAKASGCASASQNVKMISNPTPVTWDATYSLGTQCSQISFEVDPQFIDPDAKARDITALWGPFAPDANGNLVPCKTPPFLNGFQTPANFGFTVDMPNITKTFANKIPADGTWRFLPQFACQIPCNENMLSPSFPFSLTITCQP